MHTFYVMFVVCNHEVNDSWVECQRNVIFYKGSIYKAYTCQDQVVQAWMLYEPRWRRVDESSTSAVAKAQHALPRIQCKKSHMVLSSFFFFWVLYCMCTHDFNIKVDIESLHVLCI